MSKKVGYFDTMAGPVETGDRSQFAGEGLVQQRRLQRLQRGVLPLGEAGEALGGGGEDGGRDADGGGDDGVPSVYPNGVKSISPGLPSPRGYPG